MTNETQSFKSGIPLRIFLAHAGVASRRKAMDLIQKGHVAVNDDIVTEPSTPIDPRRDKVVVDGKTVREKPYEYYLLNKPKGFVTSRADEQGKRVVLDLLPRQLQHLHPVGRLDRDTEGLLLMTNDGDATYKLTHPKFNVDKRYYVRTQGRLSTEHKERLERGIKLGGKRTSPAKIDNVHWQGADSEFYITIHEGWKRQIRVMLAKLGYKVTYLKRIQQGPLKLGMIKTGHFRPLSKDEIQKLKEL